jgi:rhodanese-related sulfurtransferase
MKKLIGILAVVMFMASVLFIGNARAYETLTAQEAYNMLDPSSAAYNSNAYLVDARTTEEYVWVGTCALPDGTTPYNIPWQIWAYQFSDAGEGKVKAGGIVVESLFLHFIKNTFSEGTTLILMCRSGHRSTAGAEYLEEQLGKNYYTIYEIDNPLKNQEDYPGGCGGFQGSSSVDPNSNGYRGYPERLPFCSETTDHPCVAVESSEMTDKNDSDSWMDTGLPMTQTVDKDKIWYYMWQEGY